MSNINQNQTNAQPSLFAALQTKRPPRQTTLEEIHRMITSDPELRNNTEKYRFYTTNGFENDADKIKRQLSPAFSVAASFREKRQMAYLQGWTQYSLCDYDHISPEQLKQALQLLENDPYWVLLYVTLSGSGLRIIYRVAGVTDKKSYAQAYLQGNRHYSTLLGFTSDGQVKDATRLSALCYDPNARLRLDAQIYPVDYQQKSSKSKSQQKQGNSLLSKAVPTVIHELKKRGIVYAPSHHNEYISQACYLMNRYGIPEDDTTTWAKLSFADYGVERVAGIVHSCYQKTEEHGTLSLKADSVKYLRNATPKEISEFLTKQAVFRHNVISNHTEINWLTKLNEHTNTSEEWQPIRDRDVATLWTRMSSSLGVHVAENNIRGVIQSEFTPLFNPFQVYFDSLPPWNGQTDYIAELAAHVHLKNDNGRFVNCFRKWLVGIVPTLFSPEIVNHQILVFIGRQGNYKSSFFYYLLPPELRRYFYIGMNVERMTKDDRLTLTQYALVCFEEIDYMRPSDLNKLKAMITMRDVNERNAYAHHKEHRPHIASFCGTGNNIRFLSDPTGNRRWLPFEVEDIDPPQKHPFNYTGIYSQAYALWKSGFQYWFSQEDIKELNEHNAHFEIPNLEEELVLTYYRRPMPGESCKFITTANILERINSAIRHPLSTTKVGLVMKKLEFSTARSNSLRGYLVIERSPEEVRYSQESIARFISDAPPPPEKEENGGAELPF